MTSARIALGETGEDLACAELRRRGYVILARRCRTRSGELDIVARDGGTIAFVEVKARSGPEFGPAVDAVTPAKQRRLVRLAVEYLARHRLGDAPCRFDVVAVDIAEGRPRIEVFQNAFVANP